MYLIFPFIISVSTLFLQAVLFPGFTLLPFSPLIALTVLRASKPKSLFLSFFMGAIMDLFSSDPMGIHALCYVTVAFLSYKYRRYFLFHQPFHLGIFTSLISFFLTIFQGFFLFLSDANLSFTGKSILSDLLIMPIADGAYAMLLFGYPIKGGVLWHHLKKKVFPTIR